jgi:hypothetical protein
MIPVSDASIPKDAKTGLPIWEMFVPSDAQINAYSPTTWFTTTERIDVAYPTGDVPSDYDLELLTNGIPIVDLPPLSAYPVTIPDSEADEAADPATLAQTQAPNPPSTGAAAATLGAQSSFLLPPGTTAPTTSAPALTGPTAAPSASTSVLSNPVKVA